YQQLQEEAPALLKALGKILKESEAALIAADVDDTRGGEVLIESGLVRFLQDAEGQNHLTTTMLREIGAGHVYGVPHIGDGRGRGFDKHDLRLGSEGMSVFHYLRSGLGPESIRGWFRPGGEDFLETWV